jgi:Bacterial type II and III secretion system protein
MKEHPVKRLATFIASMVLIASAAASPVVLAQESSKLVPLKVQLVVSRLSVDKKVISSLPYTLWVTANDQKTTSVRLGVQVPVVVSALNKDGTPAAAPSYSYRDVGTNIDCKAAGQADGSFKLEIRLNDSSVSFDPKESSQSLKGVPAFRNFAADFSILVKDGQTAQYASATDPVTGETLKVDATVNVLK